MRGLLRRSRSVAALVAIVALALLAVPFVISAQTRVEPSIKVVVLEEAPARVTKQQFKEALNKYSVSQGFRAADFSGGTHLIYYFRPPELSLLTYYGDELIDVTLWKDHGDNKAYVQEVEALRNVFIPLGFKDVPP